MPDVAGCAIRPGITRFGVTECRWVTVAVGSNLGSQLGYLDYQLARQNESSGEGPGDCRRCRWPSQDRGSRKPDGIRAAASSALSGGRIPPSA